jgi:hypothetical protein
MPDVNPCTGEPGTTTQTFNDVFHGTINKTGSWFTGTTTGKIQFVPDNPASPTYTGHFQFWFGDENNLRNDVEHDTSNFRVTDPTTDHRWARERPGNVERQRRHGLRPLR